jgi:hypothetical protein
MDPPTAGLLQTRTSAKAQRGTLSLGVASHVWIIIGIQKMVKLETNRALSLWQNIWGRNFVASGAQV